MLREYLSNFHISFSLFTIYEKNDACWDNKLAVESLTIYGSLDWNWQYSYINNNYYPKQCVYTDNPAAHRGGGVKQLPLLLQLLHQLHHSLGLLHSTLRPKLFNLSK